MTTILVALALWFLLSIPFSIAVGKWMKGCDTLHNSAHNRTVCSVRSTRRRDDVNQRAPSKYQVTQRK